MTHNGVTGDVMICLLTVNAVLLASLISQYGSFGAHLVLRIIRSPVLELSRGAGNDCVVICFLPMSRGVPRRK